MIIGQPVAIRPLNGAAVKKPDGSNLSAGGEIVRGSVYWQRRVRDGSVEVVGGGLIRNPPIGERAITLYGSLADRPPAPEFGKKSCEIITDKIYIKCTSTQGWWFSEGFSDSVDDRPAAADLGIGNWRTENGSYSVSNGTIWGDGDLTAIETAAISAANAKAAAEAARDAAIASTVDIKAIQKKFIRGTAQRTVHRAIVSFVFDGAYDSHYASVFPLFESKGLKAGWCVESKSPDLQGTVTGYKQLLEMQDAGHEIMVHGNFPMINGTENTYIARSEVEEAYFDLRSDGFIINGFVASQSTLGDAHIDKYLRSLYTYGFTVYNATIGNPALMADNFDPHKLHRLGLYAAGVAGAKSTIDAAIANNAWVCFYDHDPSQIDFPSSMSLADLTLVLDYCISLGVDVMLPRDALNELNSSTIRSIAIERADENIGVERSNLCIDAEMNSFSTNDLAIWRVVHDGGFVGTVTVPIKIASGMFNKRAVTLSGNSANTGSVLIVNKYLQFNTTKSNPGLITFSVELTSSAANANTSFDVSIGVAIKKISDNSVLASNETGIIDVDAYSRRQYVSILNPSSVIPVYYEVFVRIIQTVNGEAATFYLGNPVINKGGRPALWSPGLPAPISDEVAVIPFMAISVPNATWTTAALDAIQVFSPVRYASINSGTIKILESGLYRFEAILKYSGLNNVAGKRGIMAAIINGNGVHQYAEESTGGAPDGTTYRFLFGFNKTLRLNEGDTVELAVFHGAAVTLNIASDPTYSCLYLSKVG